MSLQIILKNSAVSGKEPTASQLANGELALNYHADGPFLTCKDTAGVVRRVSGVWISTTAPSTPTPGEFWLDISVNPAVLRVYKDSTDTWIAGTTVNAASTTTAGIVELATDAETQAGSDSVRAVTPASLQSKLSSATNSTSTTTIANSAAVKAAKDVADAALPKVGGTMTGQILGDNSTSPSTPGYAFDGDPDTGLLRTGADALALVTGGTSRLTISDAGVVTIPGDLTVNGTTTTINTENLVVEDKNIQLGTVGTPSDVTADGGGITLKGTTDKTLNWVDATDSWTSSENVNLASGKTYKINGTDVLSGSALGSGVTVGASQLSGTIPSTVLGNSTAYVGTTAVALNRSSANQGLTGISSVAMPGATSGTITITPAATAGTTAITVPSTSGTLVTTGDTGTVTSTMLADGTIVNEDINASAAIAGTKVSPDFGAQNVTTTGTSTAASFSPSSATVPTNGVYLPATNSVALATASTGRLFVDASGNVGVGVTPVSALHVNTSGATTLRVSTSSSSAEPQIVLIDTSASDYFSFQKDGQAMTFKPQGAEAMRITSDGKLGLGTSSPQAILSTKPSASTTTAATTFTGDGVFIDCTNTTDSNGSYGGAISWSRSGSGTTRAAAICNVQTSNDPDFQGLAFLTHNSGTSTNPLTEAMRITSGGLVGIGTTTPTSPITVQGSVGGNQAELSGVAGRGLLIATEASGTQADGGVILRAQHTTTAHLRFDIGTTERARIDSSGRLLVGTSVVRSVEPFRNITSGANCHTIEALDGQAGSVLGIFSNGTTNNGPAIAFGKTQSTTIAGNAIVVNGDTLGTISFAGADGTDVRTKAASIFAQVDGTPGSDIMPGRLIFSTTASGAASPTERVRIDSSGNIGIRAASSTIEGQLDITNVSGTTGLVVKRSTTMAGGPYVQLLNSSTTAQIVNTGDLQLLNAAVGGSPSEKARLTTDGYFRLALSAGGIQFGGDTAAANALDDYEEGTFTPTIVGTTDAGTGTYTTQTGRYVKIGRQVLFELSLTWTAHTGTGNMEVGGLPFTSYNSGANTTPISINSSNLTVPANSYPTSLVTGNNTRIRLYSVTTGGSAIAFLAIDTAASLWLSGHYEVA